MSPTDLSLALGTPRVSHILCREGQQVSYTCHCPHRKTPATQLSCALLRSHPPPTPSPSPDSTVVTAPPLVGKGAPLYPLRGWGYLGRTHSVPAGLCSVAGGLHGVWGTTWLPSKTQPTTLSGLGPGRPVKGSGPRGSSCSNLPAGHAGWGGLGKGVTCTLIPSHVKLSGACLGWARPSPLGRQAGTRTPLSGPGRGGLWGKEAPVCPPEGEHTETDEPEWQGRGHAAPWSGRAQAPSLHRKVLQGTH